MSSKTAQKNFSKNRQDVYSNPKKNCLSLRLVADTVYGVFRYFFELFWASKISFLEKNHFLSFFLGDIYPILNAKNEEKFNKNQTRVGTDGRK